MAVSRTGGLQAEWGYSGINDRELTDSDIMSMLDGGGNMLPPDLKQAALDAIRTSLTGNASKEAVLTKIIELNQIASDIARATSVEEAKAVAERAPTYFRNIGIDMAENKDAAKQNLQQGMAGMMALIPGASLASIRALPGGDQQATREEGQCLWCAGLAIDKKNPSPTAAFHWQSGPDHTPNGKNRENDIFRT